MEIPFATLQRDIFQGYSMKDILRAPETSFEVLQPMKDIYDFRKFWNDYKYAEELVAVIARLIEGRRSSPISNIICLGISGANHDDTTGQGKLNKRRTCLQIVMFLQVVGQLI